MKIQRIFISPGHNFYGHEKGQPGSHPVIEVKEIECRAGRGICGDRFFDYKKNHKGQITFFSAEVYEALRREFAEVEKPPSAFRRNVIVAGQDLNELIDEEFEVQGVRFAGAEECSPCHWMDHAFAPGAHEFLKGRGGLRARILTDGVLRVDGDAA